MEPEAPTRLERVVDVLAKLTLALWGVGLVLLVLDASIVHRHALSLTGVRSLLGGFVVAFVILFAVVGSVLIRRVRGALSKQD